ncbi:hypothetical protein JCM17478_31380 [Thermopirellula anaerolimosa]
MIGTIERSKAMVSSPNLSVGYEGSHSSGTNPPGKCEAAFRTKRLRGRSDALQYRRANLKQASTGATDWVRARAVFNNPVGRHGLTHNENSPRSADAKIPSRPRIRAKQ